MRLDELQQAGAFAEQGMLPETVELPGKDGEPIRADVMVREMTAEEFERFFPLASGDAGETSRMRMAQEMVAVAVLIEGDDGPAPIGIDAARKLRVPWLMALFNAAMKHNGGAEKN